MRRRFRAQAAHRRASARFRPRRRDASASARRAPAENRSRSRPREQPHPTLPRLRGSVSEKIAKRLPVMPAFRMRLEIQEPDDFGGGEHARAQWLQVESLSRSGSSMEHDLFAKNRYPPSDQVRGQAFSGSCSRIYFCARVFPRTPSRPGCRRDRQTARPRVDRRAGTDYPPSRRRSSPGWWPCRRQGAA